MTEAKLNRTLQVQWKYEENVWMNGRKKQKQNKTIVSLSLD